MFKVRITDKNGSNQNYLPWNDGPGPQEVFSIEHDCVTTLKYLFIYFEVITCIHCAL